MRLPQPFYASGMHVGIDLPGGLALFTTRRGGCSGGPYESLNLGRRTDDDPNAVERNRAVLADELGVRFVYVRQVHGARVRRVTQPEAEGSLPEEADGQATASTGMAPTVLTADCLPIALGCSGAVAMLHAGWRGLAAGVIAEGARAVAELGGRGPLAAAIGPGAGPCCYEVGDEVHAVFARFGDEVRRGRNLDLKQIARRLLEEAGVDAVHDAELCTICSDPSLFYSHRRDRGITGRQAGIAWLS
jgi:purine-nucleoside/S-methyl-5'-thioadenosine phosphorylase / adenosine deaminase